MTIKLNSFWKWTKKKLIGILVVTIFIGISLAVVNSGIMIPSHLKLKAPPERILFNREIDWMEFNEETGKVVNHGKIISYSYASNIEVPRTTYQGLQEDLLKRTKNTQFFKRDLENGEEEWVGRFYTGEPFYKDIDGKWYQIKTATTTPEIFDKQMQLSWFERLLGKTAWADTTTTYSGAGDGYVYKQDSSDWDTTHNATSADALPVVTVGTAPLIGKTSGGNWNFKRGFLPFNTSGIGAGATVTAATLNVYVYGNYNNDNDGNDWVNVVSTNQADTSTLSGDDYDKCGDSIDNPTEGATRLDITTIGDPDDYVVWTLDATGRGWIDVSGWTKIGLREGHDALDDPVDLSNGEASGIGVRFSEYAGTDYDPYLSITYTLPVTRRIIITE